MEKHIDSQIAVLGLPDSNPSMSIRITSPTSLQTITGNSPTVNVNVTGTVSFTQGGLIHGVNVQVQLAPERGFEDATPGSSGWGTWSYSGALTTPGPITITAAVSGTDVESNEITDTTSVIATLNINDVTPPDLNIVHPTAQEASHVTSTTTGFSVPVEVQARDHLTGIHQLEWLVDNTSQNLVGNLNQPNDAWLDMTYTVFVATVGTHNVSVRATDGRGNVTTRSVTVTTVDTTPPDLNITQPSTTTVPVGPLMIAGTASDSLTGVKIVEWVLDPPPPPQQPTYTPADPQSPGNWSTWSRQVPITTPGAHTISVRCLDNAGNSTAKVLMLEVTHAFTSKDPDDALSPLSYLAELLDFALGTLQVSTPAPAHNITLNDLVQTFYQPFDRLTSAPKEVVNQPVRQVRLAIEVLRKYMQATGVSASADEQAAEQAYRLAAYQLLLSKIGTSYDEIRLSRVADTPTRQALAARLGIALSPIKPDQLDKLFFAPDQIGEADLERLFGLVNTTRDPLLPRAVPDVQTWQLDNLGASWKAQDYATPADGDLPAPLIDPDLVGYDDLLHPTQGNAAYDLWSLRTAWVSTQLAEFVAKRQQAERDHPGAPLTWFDTLIASVFGAVQLLLDLDADRKNGITIESRLKDVQLSMQAFLALMHLRAVANTGTLLASEWSDVYSILTHVRKVRAYSGWRTEEQQKGLVLGPDEFKLPPSTAPAPPAVYATGVDANGSTLPDGTVDPHWSISARPAGSTSTSAYVTNNAPPVGSAWVANSSTSRWISPQANAAAGDLPGAYTYKTTFDLSGFDPASARLVVKVAVDDNLTNVKLNGQSLGLNAAGYTAFSTLNITSGFVHSVNTLEFVISNAGTAANPSGLRVELGLTVAPRTVQLPAWRATWQARRDWEDTLQARLDQQQAIAQALDTAVRETEEVTLPMLRDALLAALSANQVNIDVPNWLTDRLTIDVQGSGYQSTTRVEQAIESVQSAFFSIRTGRFKNQDTRMGANPAASWELNESTDDFDKEWSWMGTHATWSAAMLVFFYPENILLPNLRPDQTQPFIDLVSRLRANQRLTPPQARAEAQKYLDDLRAASSNPPLPAQLQPPFLLTDLLTPADLLARRSLSQSLFTNYVNTTQPIPPYFKSNTPAYLKEVFFFVPLQLALQLQKSGQYAAALDWFKTVFAYNLPVAPSDQRRIYYGLELEHNTPIAYQRTVHWLRDFLYPHDIAALRANPYTRFTLMALVRCFLDYADAEFTRDTSESLATARALYMSALDLLRLPDMQSPGSTDGSTAFAPNPVLRGLRLHAELNLFKLRNGRNIAGMKRQLETYTPQLSKANVLPTLGSGGQLIAPGAALLRPTPYRYSVLIERAKQLVALSQQVEAAYLAALEKRDAENYNRLKAGQDLNLAEASVTLQDLRVTEAKGSLTLADLQKGRAQLQRDTYQGWIDAGLNTWEQAMLDSYEQARDARILSAFFETGAQMAQAAVSAAAGGMAAAAAAPAVAMSILMNQGRYAANSVAISAETNAQIASVNASYERRKQEWELQQSLAQKDMDIADQQWQIAQEHVNVVDQESMIAKTQSANAQAIADFLAKKFTNAELYEWMSGVLGRVYSYFLQQATSMARLAQNQLAFERQEAPPSFIQADYWQAPSDGNTGGTPGNQAPDRRGLTGSARLLQDIYQLDQYAFDTNKRKLQLSQTFSLARLAPFEFQRFRETGVLPFTTPMGLFDQGFPGHYLRLIKRVRTSVIALIPPVQGIRATLSNGGISRAVRGPDVFETVVIRRDPELVALSSPSNATGVFELDSQPEMLLPFEAMGVDTTWELQMPKAANPFDYHTIADVLITVEYTALHSDDYRQQVIQRLDRSVSGERSFSFRQQFADQWYELHNPEQSATPMVVRFDTTRDDFPPNLDDDSLKVQNLLLYFVRADGATFEMPVTYLHFNGQGSSVPAGQPEAITDQGIISTRRASGINWRWIKSAPVGAWELSLKSSDPATDSDIRNHFANDEIEDILFVISYSGRTPEWPM